MERIKRAFAIKLDFAKTNSINTNYTYKQYDYGANEIGIQVLFDGKVVQLDDEKVFAVFKNKDNELFLDKNKAPLKSFARIYSSEDGLIILPLPSDLMQTSGEVIAELMVVAKDHSKRLTSASFKFNIVESITYLDLTNEKPIFDTICGLYKCGEVLCAKNGSYAREGYDKTLWIDGETLIDAEKLNKIENTLEGLDIEINNQREYVDNTFQPKGDYANEEHTHNATEVIEDETHRFVTDEEKEKWDNKSDFSGDYEDLENKPSIPSRTSDLTNDSGYITIDDVDTSQNHTHNNKEVIDTITSEKINSWDNKSDFSGDYEDLTNKPNIPSIEGLATKEELNGVVEELIETIDTKASVSDLETLATKEELEELQNTVNEHLENHPSGSGEITNDYGVLSDYGDFGIIKNLPSEVEITIPFVAYIHIQRGYGVFSQNFTIANNDGIKLINYYFKDNINDWDFENSRYFVNSNAYDGESAYKEIITNSKDVYNQLVAIGISEDIITCTQNTFSEVQQLRGTTEKISEYKGKEGQIVVNTDDYTIHVMDGVNSGGTKLATEEFVLNNVPKVDLSGYYTKEEVEEKLEQIECESVDLTNYYTKEEIENKLEQIECESVDLSDYYNKDQINNLLKDLPSDGYSKEEIDNMLKDVPKLLEDMDAILTYIVGCDHSEEIALLDIINGEVI